MTKIIGCAVPACGKPLSVAENKRDQGFDHGKLAVNLNDFNGNNGFLETVERKEGNPYDEKTGI